MNTLKNFGTKVVFSMIAAGLAAGAAFAGPGLIREWGLKGPELGILLATPNALILYSTAGDRA